MFEHDFLLEEIERVERESILENSPDDLFTVTAAKERILDSLDKETRDYVEKADLVDTGLDFYFLYYMLSPLLKKEPPEKEVQEIAHRIAKEHVKTDDYKEARYMTMLDAILSTYHSKTLLKALVEELKKKKVPPQAIRNLNMPPQGGGGQGQGPPQPQGQQPQQGGQPSPQDQGQGGDQDQPQPQDQQGQQPQQGGQGDQQGGQGQDQPQPQNQQGQGQGTGQQIAEILEEALKNATEKADKLTKIAGGLSKVGTSFDLSINIADKIKKVNIAEKIVESGLKISSNIVFTKVKKIPSEQGNIAGYKLTSDPFEALPSELALPDDLFYAKLAEGDLLAISHYTRGEGSYYLLVDKSGSMSSEAKTVFSRSVAMAFLRKAKRKKWEYKLYFFDTRVYGPYEGGDAVKVLLTLKNDSSTEIFGSIAAVLKEAKKPGTLIVITDADDDAPSNALAEEILQLAKKKDIEIVAIFVTPSKSKGGYKWMKENIKQCFAVIPDEYSALRIVSTF